jgi:hypothetical protein
VRFASLSFRQKTAEKADLQTVSLLQLGDLYNWLKFYFYTSMYKTRLLLEGLENAYNNQNLLVWVILGRAALEYSAVSYHFMRKLDQLDIQGPHFKASQLQALDELLTAYGQGTRFNWDSLMDGDLEGVRANAKGSDKQPQAVNVITALQHLSKRDQGYSDVELVYGMLSDFAHPNMASHSTVVDRLAPEGEIHRWRLTPHPGTERGELIVFMTLPAISQAFGTIMEMAVPAGRLLERWLDLMDSSIQAQIDFRA